MALWVNPQHVDCSDPRWQLTTTFSRQLGMGYKCWPASDAYVPRMNKKIQKYPEVFKDELGTLHGTTVKLFIDPLP